MRVFVSEYVCGGAWPDEMLDDSLAVEGRAMLLALIEDLLRVPEVNVVTTWDRRLEVFPYAESPKCEVFQAASPTDELRVFENLCSESDAAFVIAPEFHGILAARVETALSRTRLIGCDFASTELCSDKLKLSEFLEAGSVPTVPTSGFEISRGQLSSGGGNSDFPCVIKLRDGAGSLLTFKVSNPDELADVTKQLLANGAEFRFIRQPFIDGVAVSCAAIVTKGQGGDSNMRRIDVFPPCEQILSTDGRFSYEGAEFPIRSGSLARASVVSDCDATAHPSFPRRRESSSLHSRRGSPVLENHVLRHEQIERLVHRCCAEIPGLCGYVGFDLLIPHGQFAEPIVIEINPRLTTGFLLWQGMCNDNLAARMLGFNVGGVEGPLSWKSDPCSIRISSLLP